MMINQQNKQALPLRYTVFLGKHCCYKTTQGRSKDWKEKFPKADKKKSLSDFW